MQSTSCKRNLGPCIGRQLVKQQHRVILPRVAACGSAHGSSRRWPKGADHVARFGAHHKQPWIHGREAERPEKAKPSTTSNSWSCDMSHRSHLPPRILFLEPCSMKPGLAQKRWPWANGLGVHGVPLEGCERSLSLASQRRTFPSPLT